jgi:phage tail sheath protein FI
MAPYKAPGTIIEETAKSAPTVSASATAIPAFIGYTQKTNRNGDQITPVRITSLKEYEALFGTTTASSISVCRHGGRQARRIHCAAL